MADPVSICNQALLEMGSQTTITSFQDGTPEAVAASVLYTPKVNMVSRGASWDFLRKTVALTLLRVAPQVQTTTTPAYATPPPQPFLYEYAYPSDCLKLRFMIPYITPPSSSPPLTTGGNTGALSISPNTSIPFVVGVDYDAQNNPIKVILTDLPLAQMVYTADLSQVPDLWDSLFLNAVTAVLATYFITALARNKAQMDSQVAIAKGTLDSARASNGNEAITSTDHIPDWIQIRMQSSVQWAGQGGYGSGLYESCVLGNGLSY